MSQFPCPRCGAEMAPHIIFVRIGNHQPLDVCIKCAEEIEEFAATKLHRETPDTRTLPLFKSL